MVQLLLSWYIYICYIYVCISIFDYVCMYTFLARGTGGGGKEQETVGKAPSSKVHSSTLKHLQFLRRDFLTIPLPVPSDLKPPKRGAPGVPGVAGVEGTDGISSLSISFSLKINTSNQVGVDKKNRKIV